VKPRLNSDKFLTFHSTVAIEQMIDWKASYDQSQWIIVDSLILARVSAEEWTVEGRTAEPKTVNCL
jgi:hypothetical protein